MNESQYEYAQQTEQPPKKAGLGPKSKQIIITVVLAVLALSFLSSCWYTVAETQQAVVVTLGRVTSVEEAGLHFKLPYPIQQVYKLSANVTQKIQIGYTGDDATEQTQSVADESQMITGDFNIVNVDFFIEWKISDPAKYLFASDDPVNILRNVAQSAARGVIGTHTVDGVLTEERSQIQSEIKEQINSKLEKDYDIGVQLLEVKIQDSEPPTDEVSEAFRGVETAKQERDTQINQALAYQNSKLPEAKAEADRIVREAEGERETRIKQATGEVAKFNQMYEEYSKYPAINRVRMYLETIEKVLPGVTVYVDASDGGVTTLLPLESFANGGDGQ